MKTINVKELATAVKIAAEEVETCVEQDDLQHARIHLHSAIRLANKLAAKFNDIKFK